MDKPFLKYDEQINNLKSKNLIIDDVDYATHMLKKYGYYHLICGYKDLFKNKVTKKYLDDIRFEDIIQLYEFDNSLRHIFLRYLLLVERRIKEAISDVFCSSYTESQTAYLDENNYDIKDPKNIKDIRKLINKKLLPAVNSDNYPYISHAKNMHGNVPLWVLFKAITFGSVSTMYSLLKPQEKAQIAKGYPYLTEGNLEKLLFISTNCRNTCAHGERLYSFKVKESIPVLTLHSKLKIPTVGSGNEYVHGQKDLFAVVISLRYLLDDEDFKTFKKELSNTLDRYFKHLQSSNKHINADIILEQMGFPANWKDITRYKR